MKLIIDITTNEYERINSIPSGNTDYQTTVRLYDAIKNGIPLDDIKAEIEECREDEEPHLIDYRYHRNEMLDLVLDIIDKHIQERKNDEANN